MKTIILFISLLSITFSSSALNLSGFSKEEKVAIKEVLSIYKHSNQKVVEIVKGTNTNNMIVIELTNYMYVLDDLIIESIWVLGDGDWMELHGIDISYNSEQKLLEASVYNMYEGQKGQFIEIIPTNGTPSWTLYYQDSFFDSRINSMVYYNDDITIIVGEDCVIYEDSLDSWMFLLPKCIEED